MVKDVHQEAHQEVQGQRLVDNGLLKVTVTDGADGFNFDKAQVTEDSSQVVISFTSKTLY